MAFLTSLSPLSYLLMSLCPLVINILSYFRLRLVVLVPLSTTFYSSSAHHFRPVYILLTFAHYLCHIFLIYQPPLALPPPSPPLFPQVTSPAHLLQFPLSTSLVTPLSIVFPI